MREKCGNVRTLPVYMQYYDMASYLKASVRVRVWGAGIRTGSVRDRGLAE